jgi:transcriptional regulator with XRE-family HTH domain
MTLGERIRQIRLAQPGKMTQEAFGEPLGLNRAVITSYELDKSNPPEATIRLICHEYGIDYEWLKTGKGEMNAQPEEVDVAALTNIMTSDDEFAKSLFRSFARLGPTEWRLLREFMEGVLRETDANEQKK